jgi:hypothetical protein
MTYFLLEIKSRAKIFNLVEGANSSMTYLIYCKNFCKCHNVPLPSTTIKKTPPNSKIAIPKRKKLGI